MIRLKKLPSSSSSMMEDIEEQQLITEAAGTAGLGILTAAIFLAGEMAGSGVLALSFALVGTGWSGLFLIVLFSGIAAYIGSRLGLVWEILAETHEELQQGHVRDPYPLLAEKAGSVIGPKWGKAFRYIATGCIMMTLYGGACVYIVLVANFMYSLTGDSLSNCLWMVIVATAIAPLTWFGSPKDFWFIAIGALITTMLGCLLAMSQIRIDVNHNHIETNNNTCAAFVKNATHFSPHFPPPTAPGYFAAFGTIMFAFGGASTFPTIQADMKDKSKFKIAAVGAMFMLFAIYTPTAAVGYFSLGDCVQNNIILSMSDGPVKTAASVIILCHLVSALPIIVNPPSQFFEELLKIPKEFNWKRCVFRSLTIAVLLFIGESVPSFGSILNLVGASSITCLTFVMPPILYMLAVKASPTRDIPLYERCFCLFIVALGVLGGFTATYTAVQNIVGGATFAAPCYVKPF